LYFPFFINGVRLSPYNVGESISVSADIWDKGAPVNQSFSVSFSLVNNFTNERTLMQAPTIGNAGQSGPWTAASNWQIPMGQSTGTYTIEVVVDSSGQISEGDESNNRLTSSPITIARPNDPPIPVINTISPNPSNEGETITFQATASDPNNDPIASYAWDVNGDGVFNDGSSSTLILSWSQLRTFGISDNRTYSNIRVRATDSRGASGDSAPASWAINNVRPTIASINAPDATSEGDPVTVTVEASDPAGDADPLMYEFDFDNNGSFERSESSATVQHIYPDNGRYTFRARVRDDDGGVSDPVTRDVQVLQNLPPTVDLGADRFVNLGDAVPLTALFDDPGMADTHTFNWQVTSSTGQAIPGGTEADFSFLPLRTGTYTVSLTVTDDEGAAGTDQLDVFVNMDVPPLRFLGDFVLDPDSRVRSASGVIRVGRVPDAGSSFVEVVSLDGTLSFDGTTVEGSGVVTARIAQLGLPLYSGEFEISAGAFITSLLSDLGVPNQFKVAGTEIEFTAMRIEANALGLQGTVTLPEEFGQIEVAIQDSNWLQITPSGVNIAGWQVRPCKTFCVRPAWNVICLSAWASFLRT
jgi:hypothetical protein